MALLGGIPITWAGSALAYLMRKPEKQLQYSKDAKTVINTFKARNMFIDVIAKPPHTEGN